MIGDKQIARLWASLNRAATGKRPKLHLRPQFSRSELRAWLMAQSVDGRGLAWRCAYQAPGCSDGKFAIGISEVSLDHRTPTANHAGGLTTLDNLAVSCRACNTRKADLDEQRFRELIAFLREWPEPYQKSVLRRLRQPPGQWVARGRAKAKVAVDDGEDF